MKSSVRPWRQLPGWLVLALAAFAIAVTAPAPAESAEGGMARAAVPGAPAGVPINKPLAKIWHSESTKHDYQVTVSNDLFRADWVNIPAISAHQGAFIHTECRRSGTKWVGTSNMKLLFSVPGAPPGKDTKACNLTVRFEVDSLTSLKITGHSEALRSFDVKTCKVQQTNWAPFTWVPKE